MDTAPFAVLDKSYDLSEAIELVPLAALRPHPRNYQQHPQDEIDHLKASLAQHGWYKNIVIAEDHTILAGHGLVEAARQLGLSLAPVLRMPLAPDDPEALALVVGDNEQGLLALRDQAALASLLEDAARLNPYGLAGTGYDAARLAALRTQGAPLGGDDPLPADPYGAIQDPPLPVDRLDEVMARWQVQVGDLWALGRHRLLCGSSAEPTNLARLLAAEIPQMVFADPPYGVAIVAANESVGGGEAYDIPFGGVQHPRRRGYVGGEQRQKDLTGQYPIESWGKDVRGTDGAAKPFGSKAQRGSVGASHVVPVGKYAPIVGDDSPATAMAAAQYFLTTYPDAVQVWWGGNYYTSALPASSCWLVWNKETTGNFADCELAWTNQRRAARLFTHRWNGMLRASEHERRWHPTQKPAALAAWVYATLGQDGDIVLDPFVGSGPTFLAGEQCGRTICGCEMSEEYVAIVLERWALLTGEQPTRLSA